MEQFIKTIMYSVPQCLLSLRTGVDYSQRKTCQLTEIIRNTVSLPEAKKLHNYGLIFHYFNDENIDEVYLPSTFIPVCAAMISKLTTLPFLSRADFECENNCFGMLHVHIIDAMLCCL